MSDNTMVGSGGDGATVTEKMPADSTCISNNDNSSSSTIIGIDKASWELYQYYTGLSIPPLPQNQAQCVPTSEAQPSYSSCQSPYYSNCSIGGSGLNRGNQELASGNNELDDPHRQLTFYYPSQETLTQVSSESGSEVNGVEAVRLVSDSVNNPAENMHPFSDLLRLPETQEVSVAASLFWSPAVDNNLLCSPTVYSGEVNMSVSQKVVNESACGSVEPRILGLDTSAFVLDTKDVVAPKSMGCADVNISSVPDASTEADSNQTSRSNINDGKVTSTTRNSKVAPKLNIQFGKCVCCTKSNEIIETFEDLKLQLPKHFHLVESYLTFVGVSLESIHRIGSKRQPYGLCMPCVSFVRECLVFRMRLETIRNATHGSNAEHLHLADKNARELVFMRYSDFMAVKQQYETSRNKHWVQRTLSDSDWDLIYRCLYNASYHWLSPRFTKGFMLKKFLMAESRLTHVKCVKCDEVIKNGMGGYKQHWKEQHENEGSLIIPCDFCGQSFCSVESLPDLAKATKQALMKTYYYHWISHFFPNPCPKCSYVYMDKGQCLRHVSKCNPEKIKMQVAKSKIDAASLAEIKSKKVRNKAEMLFSFSDAFKTPIPGQAVNLSSSSQSSSNSIQVTVDVPNPVSTSSCTSELQQKLQQLAYDNRENRTCKECGMYFATKQGFKFHIEHAHLIVEELNTLPESRPSELDNTSSHRSQNRSQEKDSRSSRTERESKNRKRKCEKIGRDVDVEAGSYYEKKFQELTEKSIRKATKKEPLRTCGRKELRDPQIKNMCVVNHLRSLYNAISTVALNNHNNVEKKNN